MTMSYADGRMFRDLVRVFSGFSISLALLAQAPPAAAPSAGAIAGVVVDRTRNAPLRRAIVTLSTVESPPQDAVAWTDNAGRFAFGYLPAGQYELRVTKNGYQPGAYGTDDPRRPPTAIQLVPGEVRNDLVFRMQLVTTISGLVLDEDGDPVAGVQISALRQGWQRQKRQLLPGPGAVTDSDGRYRISGLIPGRYALLASANRPVVKTSPDVSAGSPAIRYAYGRQYYPGTDQASAATLINIEAGRDYPQIDFRLAARPVTHIEGKILVPDGVASLDQPSVNIVAGDMPNRMDFGAGVSKPEYTFRFDQLPAGSYTLVAQASAEGKRYRGMQKIEVGPDGLRDLAVSVEPGVELSGTVSVAGPDATKVIPSFVSLTPGDGLPATGPPLRANVGKDGHFTIPGVLPGVWDINTGPIPPGGYIKSMYLGDQDVLTEEMVIRASTSAPLKIVLATQGASLSGDVENGGQRVRAVVLLAPTGNLRHVLSFYKSATTDAQGHFQLKGVPPGEYKLYAFDQFDPQSIQDPEFLPPLEPSGVPVTLKEGDNPPQKLVLRANP